MVAIATAQTQRAKKTTQPKSPPAVSARLERHTVQADCAGCVFVWWQERGPFGTFKTFSKNLLIHYQHLIPPTIFSPIFSPSSFISLHHVFSFDLPLLFYSLLESFKLKPPSWKFFAYFQKFNTSNSMVGLQITRFTV